MGEKYEINESGQRYGVSLEGNDCGNHEEKERAGEGNDRPLGPKSALLTNVKVAQHPRTFKKRVKPLFGSPFSWICSVSHDLCVDKANGAPKSGLTPRDLEKRF